MGLAMLAPKGLRPWGCALSLALLAVAAVLLVSMNEDAQFAKEDTLSRQEPPLTQFYAARRSGQMSNSQELVQLPKDPAEEMAEARRETARADAASKTAKAATAKADAIYSKARSTINIISSARKVAQEKRTAEQVEAAKAMKAAKARTAAARRAMANAKYAMRSATAEAQKVKEQVTAYLAPNHVARAERHLEFRETGLQAAVALHKIPPVQGGNAGNGVWVPPSSAKVAPQGSKAYHPKSKASKASKLSEAQKI